MRLFQAALDTPHPLSSRFALHGLRAVALSYPCLKRGHYERGVSRKGSLESLNQKNPRVRKILVRNSGAGNGCANFMDA